MKPCDIKILGKYMNWQNIGCSSPKEVDEWINSIPITSMNC